MRRRTGLFFIASVFFLTALPINSQSYIDYLDGRVERGDSSGTNWQAAGIGDRLGPESLLRLYPGSFVELSSANRTLSLRLPGLYEIGALFRQELSDVPVLAADSRTRRSRESVGGVRSSEAIDDGPMLPSAARSAMTRGRDLLADGFADLALEQFLEAFDFAFGVEEESEALYLLGYAELYRGNLEEALDSFSYLGLDSSLDGLEWAPSYYLSYAQALYEYGLVLEALDIVDSTWDLYREAEHVQVAYYLKGLAQFELGMSAEAETSLQEAARVDVENPFARRAQELLEFLDF